MPVPRRYQQGSIVWKDTAEGKVAYGIYRVDVQTASGIERKQKKVRLGTRKELPTDSQARKKLMTLIDEVEGGSPVPGKMTFEQLAELWQASEGPNPYRTDLQTLRNGATDMALAILEGSHHPSNYTQ